ncbi:MAG: DUF1810 domain-containing protein [Mucilaginibacter sp.]|nr:DUF1810 domain-containing protein [Mucilaginibacter sp.]
MERDSTLKRFTDAQRDHYELALAEIKAGRKRSHWMWYIFPQIAGLGKTGISVHYAIKNLQEATRYLADQTLGFRLTEICKALLALPGNDAYAVFGGPDDLKLYSSMTLFDSVPGAFPVFGQVLDKYFGGNRDQRTLDILNEKH